MANKPNKADSSKADEASKAIVANIAKEADEAKADEDEAIVAKEVNKVVLSHKANVTNEIVVANKAVMVDRANLANEADEVSLAKANELLPNNAIAVIIKHLSKLLLDDGIAVDNLLLHSLT